MFLAVITVTDVRSHYLKFPEIKDINIKKFCSYFSLFANAPLIILSYFRHTSSIGLGVGTISECQGLDPPRGVYKYIKANIVNQA